MSRSKQGFTGNKLGRIDMQRLFAEELNGVHSNPPSELGAQCHIWCAGVTSYKLKRAASQVKRAIHRRSEAGARYRILHGVLIIVQATSRLATYRR